MATYTAKCPTCNDEVSSTFSQAQANRNLGLHRRSKHGYQSPEYQEARQYRLNVKRKLVAGGAAIAELESKARAISSKITPERREQLRRDREARWGRHPLSTAPAAVAKRTEKGSDAWKAKRKAYQDAYRAKRKAAMEAVAKNNSPDAAVPCSLAACPVCGSRFYVVKGQQGG